MAILSLLLLLLLLTLCFPTAVSAACNHRRRLLHQPFFPLDSSLPPTQPPAWSPQPQPQPQQKQQQPKLPFESSSSGSSSSPPERPFFPPYRSLSPPPPPPSPTALTSFPANISSLMLPRTSSRSNRHVVAVAVSASLLSAALVASLAALFLYFRCRRRDPVPVAADRDDKASRSDKLRLYPPNTATSDASSHDKFSAATPNHSSEFLYLGTLVNSRGGADHDKTAAAAANSSNAGIKIGVSVSPPYRKLGSPELKPLPPLPKHNYRSSYRNGCDDSDEDDEEEFFSPRGSADSPGRTGSSSRRPELDCAKLHKPNEISKAADNFGSRSFNSRTPSYPCSKSPSPATSISSTKSKSPGPIINFMARSRPLPPSPSSSSSSSFPSLSERGSGNSENSPSGISSDVPKQFATAKLPPAPPPLPPPRFWEIPAARSSSGGPPVLVTPSASRPAVAFHNSNGSNNASVERNEENNPSKPKLKPLHWDKVRASSDRAMVWDQLKSSSFQLNEAMIETLFTANNANVTSKDNGHRHILGSAAQEENRVLDPKKSQNIAILLRALNVTVQEVCEGLLEGNSDGLGTELLESLLKMAPNKEEEWKLREYKDDSSFKLGPAEKFLKAVLEIPFAFKRVDALLYIANFDSEVDYLRRSFATLEVACGELKNSRLFMKLLEAVLKTGNRMNVGTNRGDAHAFKLDTLLKLVDVKGADGKTTLLHFVVQEIIRAEGLRLSGANQNASTEKNQQSSYWDDVEFRKLGLQVVSGLSGELSNVKKAAAMDSDVLSNEVAKLAGGISKVAQVLKSNEEVLLKESSGKFSESMSEFLKRAGEEIEKLQAQEKMALSLLKELTEYFHGNSAKEEAHRFRIFTVVRDFLSVLDQVCKEVGKVNERSTVGLTTAREFSNTTNPLTAPVFPRLNGRQQYGSSDDESSSSS